MGDQLLSLASPRFRLIPEPSNEGHGIGTVRTPAGGEAAQSIRWSPRPLAQDDAVLGDLDVESVASLDTQSPPRCTGNDDLMLGTHLDTKHDARC